MRCTFYGSLLLLLGLLLTGLPGQANHLVGGQLEMRAVGDVAGHFVITLTNYYEDNTAARRIREVTFGLFRKRDNALMGQFPASEQGTRRPIIYANTYCATQRNLNFIVATFTADVRLTPSQYADAQGYYVSYQTQFRNTGVNNLVNPSQTGYTFYLDMPPLTTTGRYLHNSSPQFPAINGEYVCLDTPFTFPFGGTDPDGDELRYSLVTPLNQRGTRDNTVSAGPYPPVVFSSGFSATNAIPGNPTLAVNSATGQLSVTASGIGLFVFAVLVEEYRNGLKIGAVQRDFQFLVVDCPKTPPLDPVALIRGLAPTATKTTLGPGESATLVVTSNPDWNYQWQRDNLNLTGATGSELVVKDQGVYTVQVTHKNACANATTAQSLTINSLNTTPTLTSRGQLCATDGSVTLMVSALPDMRYEWLLNGQLVAGATDDQLTLSQPGTYQARLIHLTLGCRVLSEERPLSRAPAVQALLRSASGFNRICPGSQLELLGDGGNQYRWMADGQPILGESSASYSTGTTGTFSLTVTDANGCRGIATPLTLSAVAPITPTLAVVPPLCGTLAAAQTLVGQPQSGTFAGPGVSGAIFMPAQAGVGQHVISYSIRPAPECAAVTASQTAIVHPIPTIDLPEQLLTFRYNSLTLAPPLTGDPVRFLWTPAEGLRDNQTAAVQIDDIRQPITYTVWVQNVGSCTATASIRIDVVDHLYAPDAFTPNGDGDNDQWVLTNAAAFPDLDVTIFNRWGTAVYHATGPDQPPFDGRQGSEELPGGVYAYVIRYAPQFPPLKGRLLLLR